MSHSILEGVNEKTTKSVLLDKLRDAAKTLAGYEDKRVGRLQEIEERVRRKYAGSQQDLIQILATATEQEWSEAADFLENFEDLLPVALLRIHEGAKEAVDHHASASAKASAPA